MNQGHKMILRRKVIASGAVHRHQLIVAGNMFPKKGNKLHQPRRGSVDALNFNEAIAAALRLELGATHRAVKTAMRWTGASKRIVKNWLSGDYGPNGEHLVQLLRNSESVLQALLILADRRGSMSESTLIKLREHLMAAVRCLEMFE